MNLRRPLYRLSVPLFGLLLAGCGGRAPEDAVKSLLLALSEPAISPAQLGASLMEVLDRPTLGALEARAAALSKELGVVVRADEMLLVQGLPDGLRLRGLDASSGDGKATLALTFAVVGPPRALLPDPVSLNAAPEDGTLRLSLGSFLARVAVEGSAR